MLPTVSIVVPVKNEEKVVENCIKSLLRIDYPHDRREIIIVTDTNIDRTMEICKKYEPKIKVIKTKVTKNKAEALNIILPKLKGEIIAIFDADCIVDKDCIKNAVKRFDDNKVMGVTGLVRHYNGEENVITRLISLETNITLFQEHVFDKLGLSVNLLGRNMFLRKSIFKKIKGFDEYTFTEDIELSCRMRRYNYRTVFEPSALTYDESPPTIKDVLRQRLRFFRGFMRIKNKLKPKNKKELLEDISHGFDIYLSSLSSFLFLILIISTFFSLPSVLVNFSILIVLFQSFWILISNLYFKQPLEDLLLIPYYLVFFNINFYSFFRSWYKERKKESMQWYKAERSGVIKK